MSRGESADAALAGVAQGERGAVRAIALGTLRWYLRLAPAVDQFLSRPAALPGVVSALLVSAAHQIEYSRNAPEATVNAAVDAVRLLNAPRVSALVNAVLRRFVAGRPALFAATDADLAVRTAHPAWLVERIRAAWPDALEQVLAADNQHPPMTLRIDLSRVTREAYMSRLAEAGIDSHAIQWTDSGVTLTYPMGVSELPGFSEGLVSVQDAGAALAAALLDVRPGMRVLDACAAPGGKTGALLELAGEEAEVTALDIDASRVALIGENLRRLNRRAHLVVGDAADAQALAPGAAFERILVDAPCSSTGVIRRHPDIKLLRRPGDIRAFATQQLALLRNAVRLLSPAGRLLYATCSILPEENEAVVTRLLAAEPGMAAAAAGIRLPPGARACAFGWQLLPGAEAGTDGFYYACLEKTTAGA